MNTNAHLERDRDAAGHFVKAAPEKRSHRAKGDATGAHAVAKAPGRDNGHLERDERIRAVTAAGYALGANGWTHPVLGLGGGVCGGLEQAYSTTVRYRGERWARMLEDAGGGE